MVDEILVMTGKVQVISGGARGVDKRAEEVARRLGYPEPIVFKPKWRRPNGKTNMNAGKERNTKIINNADYVIAFWNNKSRGTKDSIMKAWRKGLPLIVFIVDGKSITVKVENFDGSKSELCSAAKESAQKHQARHAQVEGESGQ
jgi:hypothetical protein